MIDATQEQKEILNTHGIEVIEFKRMVIKCQEFFDSIMEYVKNLVETMKPIIEAIKKRLESEKVSAKNKYKVCKSLGIDYLQYIKRNQIYRCRNNC